MQERKSRPEIEDIIESFRPATPIEPNDTDAEWEADRGMYVRKGAELGIGRRQAQILHENLVPLPVTRGLRDFGWGVEDMVKRTLDRHSTKDGDTLQEVLRQLKEEERKGLREKTNFWDPPRTFEDRP